MLPLFLILLSLRDVQACASLGSGTDSQLFQNPTLQWTMNPPTSWTYPTTYAQITQQYFPGQPLTQADANNQADGDMTAAVLEALANNNLPTQNVKIVSNYQPQMVSDCVKVAGTAPIPTQTKSGDMFGIAEQGAITQIATATADLAIADCAARTFKMETFQPYIVSASLSIEGITLSGLQLKQLVAQLQSQLNFNNRVRFVTPITYS